MIISRSIHVAANGIICMNLIWIAILRSAMNLSVKTLFKLLHWEFPGGPVVRTLRFHCRGHRFQAAWCGQTKTNKQKNPALRESRPNFNMTSSSLRPCLWDHPAPFEFLFGKAQSCQKIYCLSKKFAVCFS